MSQDHSFDDLMAQLRTGDDDAATRVYNRFAQRLIDLARRRLGPQVRQKVDPEDVLQSVFRSFFTHQAAGQLSDLETWDSLWAMLVVITVRKCGRRIDFFRAARRDMQREVSIPHPADHSSADWETRADEPTPSEAAILTETLEQVMNHLEGRHRQIVTLSLQGHTVPEISDQVGLTERTVYRVLERVKTLLQEMSAEAV